MTADCFLSPKLFCPENICPSSKFNWKSLKSICQPTIQPRAAQSSQEQPRAAPGSPQQPPGQPRAPQGSPQQPRASSYKSFGNQTIPKQRNHDNLRKKGCVQPASPGQPRGSQEQPRAAQGSPEQPRAAANQPAQGTPEHPIQTDRKKDRETDMQEYKQTETDRQANRMTDIQTERQTDKEKERDRQI